MSGMMQYSDEKMRKGVKEAITTIFEFARKNAKQAISIVAPCRYGKSDIIRMSVFELVDKGFSSIGVVLMPGIRLANQLIDISKVQAMMSRYEVKNFRARVGIFTTRKQIQHQVGAKWNQDGCHLITATIQLVSALVGMGEDDDCFLRWCQQAYRKTGKPVVIFIDECHYTSNENTWGSAIQKLISEANVRVVLLTATPFRADNERIPGFEWEELSKEEKKISVIKHNPELEEGKAEKWLYEVQNIRFKLKPDFEVTLKDAMDETPSPICHLVKYPVQVSLREIGEEGESQTFLHEIESDSKTRLLLSRACRNETVIRKLAETGMRELNYLRRSLGLGWAKAIAFCGCDTTESDSDSQHIDVVAWHIQEVCKENGFDYRIVQATCDNSSADKVIEDFVSKGQGDILLVKYMGGVGLDAAVMKVGIDFTSVRTMAAWQQRVFRVATPYEVNNARMEVGRWITIDDSISIKLWENLIKNQDCEYEKNEQHKLLDVEIVDINGTSTPPDMYTIEEAIEGGISDIHGGEAGLDAIRTRDLFTSMFPDALDIAKNIPDTRWEEFCQRMNSSVKAPPKTEKATTKEECPKPGGGAVTVQNLSSERQPLVSVFNAVKNLQVSRTMQREGNPYKPKDKVSQERFESLSKEIHKTITNAVGHYGKVSVKAGELSLNQLRQVVQSALRFARHWNISDQEIIARANQSQINHDFLKECRSNV